jgi:hypothetical protein
MATAPERPLGTGLSVHAGPRFDDDGSLGHFLEDDARGEDAYGKLLRLLNLGLHERMGLLQRILARCTIDENGCWCWEGPDSGSGRGGNYGRFSFEGTTASVHRVVYTLCYGPIPNKKQIDHNCNNRSCCNPEHLVRMTHKRNQKLRDKRRRKC